MGLAPTADWSTDTEQTAVLDQTLAELTNNLSGQVTAKFRLKEVDDPEHRSPLFPFDQFDYQLPKTAGVFDFRDCQVGSPHFTRRDGGLSLTC